MKVEFLQDFRGRETGEVFYTKGQIVEGERFAFLAERGIVKIIPDPQPEPVEQPKPEPKRKAGKK